LYSYIARQPILDVEKNLVAYELLFRDGEKNSFPNIDPNKATSNILSDNHLTLGIEQVTGQFPAYINFNSETLIRRFPSFLDAKKVVIEIVEDVEITPDLINTCKNLKDKGYTLALDDYDFDDKWQLLLPYIDIIKVDVLTLSILEISRSIRKVADFSVTLLAEKVETHQQFQQLKLLGFELFQGYFFAKPEIVKQKKLTASKQNILDLISHVSAIELDFSAISQIFSTDPGLTFKLLRFINSPYYGRSQEITSLKHALAYIGDTELRKFIALLSLADLSEGKSSEIIKLSLIRAKFCEFIAIERDDEKNPPKAFLVGLLSFIDGILDHDIEQLLSSLPVHADIKSALLGEEMYLSDYLKLTRLIEQGQWMDAERLMLILHLSKGVCLAAYRDAIAWADELLTIA